MKKMVCEICGSQSIKKEKGVFVCKECGTEYSLEEARNLLVEAEDSTGPNNSVVEPKSFVEEKGFNSNADVLKKQLLLWADILKYFDTINYLYKVHDTNSSDFWNNFSEEKIEKTLDNNDLFSLLTKCYKDMPNDEYSLKEYLKYGDYCFEIQYEKWMFNDIPFAEWASSEEKMKRECEAFRNFLFTKTFMKEQVKQLRNNDFMIKEIKALTMDTLPVLIKDQEGIIDWPWCNYKTSNGIPKLNYYDFDKNDLAKYFYRISIFRYNELTGSNFIGPYAYKYGYFTGAEKRYPVFPNFNFKEAYSKVNTVFNKLWKDFNKYLEYVNGEGRELVIHDAEKYIEISKELEKDFFLPYEYRDIYSIYGLISLLDSGKASTWKELANLFDTYDYRNSVKCSLGEINNRLANIESRLSDINSTLQQTNELLYKIGNKLEFINNNLSMISKNVSKIRTYEFFQFLDSLD